MDYILRVELYVENTGDIETLPFNSLGIKLNEFNGFEKHETYLNYNEAIAELGYRYCKKHNIRSFADGNYLLYFNCDNPQQIIRKPCYELEEELGYEPEKTNCIKAGKVFDEYIVLSEETTKEIIKIFNFFDIYNCTADLIIIRQIMKLIKAKCNYFNLVLANSDEHKALMRINIVAHKD